MKYDKEKTNDIQRDDEWVLQPGLKTLVGFWAAGQRVKLDQRGDDEERDEDAADFAQYESQILPALQPPVGGNAFAIPARVVKRISGSGGSGLHFPPQGRRTDLNQSSAAVNLYCWMAPAGST